MTDSQSNNEDSEVWMTLGDQDGPSDAIPRRKDEDLPWVLDPERMENWSDDILYKLELSFREWLFKSIKSPHWKVPASKGHWNEGNRMTFNKVREQFNIDVEDYELRSKLTKLCKHYATRVKQTRGGIKIKGVRNSPTGYSFPRSEKTVKQPYNLRLRFEMMMAEGKVVTLNNLRVPPSENKTIVEMNATRRLQNIKASEYQRRWKEKYGDKYDYS